MGSAVLSFFSFAEFKFSTVDAASVSSTSFPYRLDVLDLRIDPEWRPRRSRRREVLEDRIRKSASGAERSKGDGRGFPVFLSGSYDSSVV